jgi:Protein of unknown function (DUF3617)
VHIMTRSANRQKIIRVAPVETGERRKNCIMITRNIKLVVAGFLSLGIGSAAQSVAAQDGASLLQTLERGLWQLRAVGSGSSAAAASEMCISDPRMLAQIQHGAASCTHQTVESTANTVTISYSCKGAGQGLTTIRKESGRLVQIQSQGIRNNSPFSFSVEGRRSGAC